MRKNFLLAVSMILLFFCSSAGAEELPWEMKTPFKEATIHYELTGSEQGKKTLYIKDHGQIRATYHQATSKIMGMSNTTNTIELIDPEWVYTFDLIEKSGEKTTNPNKMYREEYTKLNAEEKKNFAKNAKELGSSMMSQFGGSVKQKSDKILGYDCDVTTVGGMSTVYLLHGTDIPLRSEVAVMGMNSTQAATKMDTNTAIADSVFSHPAGITATVNQEAEQMMSGTIQQVMDTLKRPDGAKQMQQFGPPATPGMNGMQQGMEAEGISKEEQEEMMRQLGDAMQQMEKVQSRK